MNEKQLKALAKEVEQGLNSKEDIAALTKQLWQSFYQKALDAELDGHLGYDRHGSRESNNSRNGYTKKTVQINYGMLEINTPRDQQNEFKPQIIKKLQTRTSRLDSKIFQLICATIMTTRGIVDTLSEFYDTAISHTLTLRVTWWCFSADY